ncbi:MAG: hypothetical protein ACRDFS_00405, partial [Chloroflexota bacterium]
VPRQRRNEEGGVREGIRVREITPTEGNGLLRIVRRSSGRRFRLRVFDPAAELGPGSTQNDGPLH